MGLPATLTAALARWTLLAMAGASALLLCGPAGARAQFGLQPGVAGFDASIVKDGGAPATSAGSHPLQLSAHVGFSGGDPRNLRLRWPSGLIENPRAVPQCTQGDFASGCAEVSQVGLVEVRTGGIGHAFALFNLDPAPGYPTLLGARPFGAPMVMVPEIHQGDGEYGITLTVSNLSQIVAIEALDVTLWGVPWAVTHDGQRGACLNELDPESPNGQCHVDPSTAGQSMRAYLTMPTDCSTPLRFAVAATGWGPASSPVSAALERQTPSDCEGLGYSFGANVLPSTAVASSPSGLTLTLAAGQAGLTEPGNRLISQPRRVVVSLAEGITINPSVGAGLGSCSPAQFAAESASSVPGEGCPNPSKIGVGSVESPLVDEPLQGSLFVATPFDNPSGSPYGLYFVAKAPQRGFVVKVPGRLDADPASGRLVATFEDLPQLPYKNLKLEFREGQRAPLVSPAACGRYWNRTELRPWSNPSASTLEPSSFPIVRGVGGGPCQSGGAPFQPKAVVGSLNSTAGFNSDLYLHLTRTDAEQEITSYSAALPPGLLGAIAGIPFCSDAAIAAAGTHRGGEELGAPSCPEASRIGRTYSGYGVGLAPAYAPGSLYLAGPYRGAPLSVVAINPAIVGPFDLGTVVVRSAIQVDEHSARVTIDSSASDPIPHIFSGIPLRLRDIRIYVDRPRFIVNPTNCSPFSIVSTLTGSDVPFVDPRGASASQSVPFQVTDCIAMGYSPRFSLRLKGSPKRGRYPRLRAVFTPRPRDANTTSASVALPPSIFLEQRNVRGICTRPQAEAEACPGASIVGNAVARTPLLAEPLSGPVYLRSSSNPLPDLVAALHWGGVRILLEGRVDTFRGGLRASFDGLPDAPVSSFTMTLFGGRKRGILVNADNLCRSAQLGRARFFAHNGYGQTSRPRLAIRCPKAKRVAKRHGRRPPSRTGAGTRQGGTGR